MGVRYHTDTAERYHIEEGYFMQSGAMVRSDTPAAVNRDATGSARALAAYAQDQVDLGPVTITAGLRGELVETESTERAGEMEYTEGSYSVLIPGLGAVYQVLPELGLLAGVAQGIRPGVPGSGKTRSSPRRA